MQYYGHNPAVEIKRDSSPVTEADIAAHDYITHCLTQLTPSLPIVSEENSEEENLAIAKKYSEYWLVDPLDGTKSFIKQSGDFTVNIALIKNQRPVQGVIYLPISQTLYYAENEKQAFKQTIQDNTAPSLITVNHKAEDAPRIVVASLSHRTQATNDFIATLNVESIVAASSSVKLCLVAEGQADIYPRFGPTCEWDIAAGHAIVNAAGGKVCDLNGQPLLYGKESLLNPYFIASA